MRDFNKREKDIIRELVLLDEKYDGYFVIFIRKFIYPLSDGSAIYFDFYNRNLYLMIPLEEDGSLSYTVRMSNRFYEFLSLITYLRDNRYISIFTTPSDPGWHQYLVLGEQFNETSGVSEHGFYADLPPQHVEDGYSGPNGRKNKKISHYSTELGKGIYQLACENFLNKVYISEDLKQLVKRDFQSIEAIRHRKQQIVSWIAAIVAFVTLIVTGITLYLTVNQ